MRLLSDGRPKILVLSDLGLAFRSTQPQIDGPGGQG
jgi:hypothetical protein